MNEPRQNSFSANTSAWRFVAGWNLKYPDVCGTAIVGMTASAHRFLPKQEPEKPCTPMEAGLLS